MIRKPRSRLSGCFRMGAHTPNSEDHAVHRAHWSPVSLKNRALSPPLLVRTDGPGRLCGLVQAPPSPESLQLFVSASPTDGTPWLSLHPDNARMHTTATTVYFLSESDVQLLPHTPYSPDLSPRDFFLFTEMRKQMKGTLFGR